MSIRQYLCVLFVGGLAVSVTAIVTPLSQLLETAVMVTIMTEPVWSEAAGHGRVIVLPSSGSGRYWMDTDTAGRRPQPIQCRSVTLYNQLK